MAAAAIGCTVALAPAQSLGAPPRVDGGSAPADWVPPEFQKVGIDEHLGDSVPGDVTLRDEAGQPVRLGSFFAGDKPVVVNFVYHTCATLCTFVQSGFSSSMKQLGPSIGKDFEVLTISIDPRDTPEIARTQKERWVSGYGRDRAVTEQHWHFLTGDEPALKRVTEAVGFRYFFDAQQNQYAHGAGLFVLTPAGKIARYLYGIEFPATDLRLALAEAREGRATSSVEHLLLYCYRYDPHARGYVIVAWRVMRLAAAATVGLLGGFLGLLWLRERRQGRRALQASKDSVVSQGTVS